MCGSRSTSDVHWIRRTLTMVLYQIMRRLIQWLFFIFTKNLSTTMKNFIICTADADVMLTTLSRLLGRCWRYQSMDNDRKGGRLQVHLPALARRNSRESITVLAWPPCLHWLWQHREPVQSLEIESLSEVGGRSRIGNTRCQRGHKPSRAIWFYMQSLPMWYHVCMSLDMICWLRSPCAVQVCCQMMTQWDFT